MTLWKSWVIATKDFSIFRTKKRILYTLIILPLLFSIILPLVISSYPNPLTPIMFGSTNISLLNFFSFFYIFLAYLIPTTIASYSIISEKIEQSLEPLLATPITDDELLLGKSIAALLPCLAMIYISSIIFMVLTDVMTYKTIGYYFFPNLNMAIILLIAVPLSSILSVELNVIISSKVNDVRTAQQLGTLQIFPFVLIYGVLETSIVSFNIINMLGIFMFLLVICVLLFYVNKATFQRDKILTNWK